jgi:hypothetical protein
MAEEKVGLSIEFQSKVSNVWKTRMAELEMKEALLGFWRVL